MSQFVIDREDDGSSPVKVLRLPRIGFRERRTWTHLLCSNTARLLWLKSFDWRTLPVRPDPGAGQQPRSARDLDYRPGRHGHRCERSVGASRRERGENGQVPDEREGCEPEPGEGQDAGSRNGQPQGGRGENGPPQGCGWPAGPADACPQGRCGITLGRWSACARCAGGRRSARAREAGATAADKKIARLTWQMFRRYRRRAVAPRLDRDGVPANRCSMRAGRPVAAGAGVPRRQPVGVEAAV